MNSTFKNKLVVVVAGPTASGKTGIGVELAKYFNSEVISADSRQFYKQMQIGTARPSDDELKGVPHHFMGNLNIEEELSAGKFARIARQKIEELFTKHDIVFVVGGSGLYIDALIYGIDEIPSVSLETRNRINTQWKEHGLEYLQKRVEQIDPALFKQIDKQNPVRLIRAIEVYEGTGKPLSSYYKNKSKEPIFSTLFFGLELEREILYNRINERVDLMIKNGLIQEAENLKSHKHLNSLKTVGYSELFEYFDDKITLDKAIELIKRNSRRYAKRQLTWLRRSLNTNWVNPKASELIQFIESSNF